MALDRYTVPETSITLEDGVHPALWVALRDDPTPEGWITKTPTIFRWTFYVWSDPEQFGEEEGAQELSAISSGTLVDRSKARKWIEKILGRPMQKGERLTDIVEDLPLACMVEVKNNTDSGFVNIESVLTATKSQKRAKIAAALLVPGAVKSAKKTAPADDEEDIPF